MMLPWDVSECLCFYIFELHTWCLDCLCLFTVCKRSSALCSEVQHGKAAAAAAGRRRKKTSKKDASSSESDGDSEENLSDEEVEFDDLHMDLDDEDDAADEDNDDDGGRIAAFNEEDVKFSDGDGKLINRGNFSDWRLILPSHIKTWPKNCLYIFIFLACSLSFEDKTNVHRIICIIMHTVYSLLQGNIQRVSEFWCWGGMNVQKMARTDVILSGCHRRIYLIIVNKSYCRAQWIISLSVKCY